MKKNELSETYWEERYKSHNIGWDLGQISPPLEGYINQLKNQSTKILIPGAGHSYEAEYLWRKGFKNLFVLDIAKRPLIDLKKRIPEFPDHQLLNLDFFSLQNKFDLILEQTFFCALHPSLRQNYATKMSELLHPEGKLVGLLFNFELTSSGPPFGGQLKDYELLFKDHFVIKRLEPSRNSIKERRGKELFFIFEKKREWH